MTPLRIDNTIPFQQMRVFDTNGTGLEQWGTSGLLLSTETFWLRRYGFSWWTRFSIGLHRRTVARLR